MQRTRATRPPTAVHRLPPPSTAAPSPPHLHLHHEAVVAQLGDLLTEDRVVGHDLEVVTPDEILGAQAVAGFAVARDLVVRIELLHASHDLETVGSQQVRPEHVPPGPPHIRATLAIPHVL